MINNKKKGVLSDCVDIVDYEFFHKVSEDGVNFKDTDEETDTGINLHFFTNYYEFAKKLYKIGIFSVDNVEKIKDSINTQVKNTKFQNLYSSFLDGGRKRKIIKYTTKRKSKKLRKLRKLRKSRKKMI